ncbi:acyltransferase [Planktomarina temperata]|nr:acyltransferase [Planktomarina temperata]
MKHRAEIDGLRGIAVSAVVISHTGIGVLTGGFFGVDVFFVLSGFLITQILFKDLENRNFKFRHFYLRRTLRILPALLVMLILTTIWSWLFLIPSDLIDFSVSAFFTILFLANAYFIDLTGYFAPQTELMPLLHTWSLAVEEQFYFVFPILAFIGYKLGHAKGLFSIILVLCFASFTLSIWGDVNKPDENYFFSPSRFWQILLGGIVAVYPTIRKQPSPNPFISNLGLVMILTSFFFVVHHMRLLSLWSLAPTLGTCMVLMYSGKNSLSYFFLTNFLLRWIGLISFSLYLWHQPIFAFARLSGISTAQPISALILIALITGISFLSWRFVEQIFRLRAGAVFVRPSKLALLVITAVIIVVLAFSAYLTQLPYQRYGEVDRNLLSVSRIDATSYQRSGNKNFDRRDFNDPQSNLVRVAVVGDSFARDFLNVLNTANTSPSLDVSLWLIGGECMPFYLQNFDFRLEDLHQSRSCLAYDIYKSPKMLRSLKAADIILLASNWRDGQGTFLEDTIKNIRKSTGAKVIIVGPKIFGNVDIKKLLAMTPNERTAFRTPIPAWLSHLNSDLAKIPMSNSNVQFVDIFKTICDQKGCPQVTPSGWLISLDGRHLTFQGASYLAKVLSEQRAIERMFAKD